jgi:nucleoside-diphosphate-sugar epimerase
MATTLIVGTGYTGETLGESLASMDEPVAGTRRSPEGDAPFPVHEYELGNESQWTSVLDEIDGPFRCVFTAGPPRGDDLDESLSVYESFLKQCPADRMVNFTFLSSTSVYGDADGEWVTETSPVDPVSRSGQLKRDAERLTRTILEPDVPVVHARIGGIYGPGRNPARRYLSEDYRLVGEGKKPSNRIHRTDLVRALIILSRFDTSSVFNLTDRKPVPLRTILEFLYRETGRDPATIKTISWEEAEERYSEMRLGLLKPRKKVSSQKLRKDIGFEFRYPTVFEGFRSLPPIDEID